ncbi:VOC family protein [Polyangium aurulentum]|uniref:VOC family protein n=1 Tax=Polyangium aurulentum TaxID=2567896 RepID=UPI0010ADF781|nr:VOC family protein [Polyangium aurulentum]UQA58009.1 VOC family protein [Polyangium aurulentum]
MIDHVSVRVHDFDKAKQFYKDALAPLGYQLLMDYPPHAAGFGVPHKPDFWIGAAPEGEAVLAPTHVAIAAPDRATVDAFHRAAIAAGGKDNGAPGPRPQYHPGYYGAFILDADGNNIEAVCHQP